MSVVEIKRPSDDRWLKDATYLRELADRVERGEIPEFAVALNDKENDCYEKYAAFADRWRLLAALEYAKDAVQKG